MKLTRLVAVGVVASVIAVAAAVPSFAGKAVPQLVTSPTAPTCTYVLGTPNISYSSTATWTGSPYAIKWELLASGNGGLVYGVVATATQTVSRGVQTATTNPAVMSDMIGVLTKLTMTLVDRKGNAYAGSSSFTTAVCTQAP